MVKSTLVQDGGCESTKAVSSLPSFVSHAIQGKQNGVVAHRPVRIALAWEQQFAATCQRLEQFQNFNSLFAQRYDVWCVHLHTFSRNIPSPIFKIEFRPSRFDQLACANECQRHEFDCKPCHLRSSVDFNCTKQGGKLSGIYTSKIDFLGWLQNV